MIELNRIFPFLDGMAELASSRLAVQARRGHKLSELAFVNVLMATRAVKLNKVIYRGFRSVSWLVAIIAWHGPVRFDEWEAGFLMQCQGVIRSLPGSPVVAPLATIKPRSSRKLALMFVLMAVRAQRKFDLVLRPFALRDVAISALNFLVRCNKWEASFGMIHRRVYARFPAFDFMAALTLSTVGALQKLSAVRIWFMAIRAP